MDKTLYIVEDTSKSYIESVFKAWLESYMAGYTYRWDKLPDAERRVLIDHAFSMFKSMYNDGSKEGDGI